MLKNLDFQNVKKELAFSPTIDLFTSMLYYQILKFASYRPDSQSFAVSAVTVDWGKLPFYAIPPFVIIARVT